jgi:hypothetical protein
MQIIRLAKLQYIRHATHSITSQYVCICQANRDHIPRNRDCDDPFFFFFENIQTDLHSGTTTCRTANITYMYLIFRVTSNTAEYKYQYAAEHISIAELHLIHNCYQQQESFTSLSI